MRTGSAVTPGRYVASENGDVYDTWGRYYISAELWRRRMDEGRTDRADHDFALGESVDEPDVPTEWGRVNATCAHCGERRLVWRFVDMRNLNNGWCIPRRSIWGRLARAIATQPRP